MSGLEPRRAALLCLALAWAATGPAGAAGQDSPPEEREVAPGPPAAPEVAGRADERMRAVVQGPSALVVSGGSSLGVYEAGVLYYYTLVQASAAEQLRGAEASRFSVVTGTSAGAINAFMAAMATCQEPNPDPRASPFWLWTTVDWSDLLDAKDDVNGCGKLDGALTRKPVRQAVERLDRAWDGFRWRPCEVLFGAAVAYLTPLKIPLRPSPSTIEIARLTERFAFRMTSDGRQPAALRAFRGSVAPEFPLLASRSPPAPPPDDPLLRNRKDVMELLLASSGIPGAFDPVALDVIYDPRSGAAQTQCFVDGGMLDNVPLSTAIRLMKEPGSQRGRGKPAYLYVDASNVEPPPAPAAGAAPAGPAPPGAAPAARRSMVGDLGLLLGDVITGARQAELAETIAENQEVRESLELPRRKHFITGELLFAFGAFFDESFRRYDFLAGVADAERSLAPALRVARSVRRPAVDAPEYPCFQAVWRADSAEQIGKELLGPECAYLRPPPGDDGTEARIRRDLWRILSVVGTGELDVERPRRAYDFLHRLDHSTGPAGAGWDTGYEYVTLRYGKKRAEGHNGLVAVREQLQDLSSRLSSRLRSGAGISGLLYASLASTAGNELANSALDYRRIPWSLSVGLYGRGAELALARRFTLASGEWFGLDAVGGLQLADYALERGDIPGYMDFRAFLGPRAEIRFKQIAPLELLLGGYAVGQGGYSHGFGPIYRVGMSARVELQVFQRIYAGIAYTDFLRKAARFRTEDWSGSLGLRLWL